MELSFKEIAKSWFDSKKKLLKPSSASAYYTVVYNGLIPFFYNRKINNDTVQEYVIHCDKKKLSKRTVLDHVKILTSILKEGEEMGFCKAQIFDVELPTSLDMRKRESSAFLVSDIKKLRTHLVESSTNNNLYDFATLISLSLGLRIGETTGLKFSDFDFRTKMVFINRTSQRITMFNELNEAIGTNVVVGSTKTKSSSRKLPVPEVILNIVKLYSIMRNPDDYIFKGRYSNKPMDNRLLRVHFYKALSLLNIPKNTFHGLRHSFASNCIASNIDVKTTSSMLGHSDIKMTLEIYTHPSLEQKKAAINKLGKLFS